MDAVYPHKQQSEMKLTSCYIDVEKKESPVEITIKLVGEVHYTDAHYLQVNNESDLFIFVKIVALTRSGLSLQFHNLLLRQTMEKLNLQQVGRNFYDERAKFPIHGFKMEIWPGYTTSIRRHEEKVCCILPKPVHNHGRRSLWLQKIIFFFCRSSCVQRCHTKC